MVKKCCWCQEYFCHPKNKVPLCSYCLSLWKDGKYVHGYNLRKLSQRQDKENFKDATPPNNLPDTLLKRIRRADYQERVASLTHNIKPIQKLVKSQHSTFTPISLYGLLLEFEVWMTSSQATELLNQLRQYHKPDQWEHVIGCRVIDHWNLDRRDHGIAECYYNLPCNFPTSLDGIPLPKGRVYCRNWLS